MHVLWKIPRNAEPLVDRLAGVDGYACKPLQNSHKARQYRNKLLHDLSEEAESFMSAGRPGTSVLSSIACEVPGKQSVARIPCRSPGARSKSI